jgi:hypothetical protein
MQSCLLELLKEGPGTRTYRRNPCDTRSWKMARRAAGNSTNWASLGCAFETGKWQKHFLRAVEVRASES